MLIIRPPGRDANRARSGGPAIAPSRRVAFLALATMLAPGFAIEPAARAQTAPAPAESSTPSFSEEVSVAWILVPVIVRGKGSGEGGYVNGLDRADFTLKVDGRATWFPDFEPRGEAPWSVVFLQDLSGSMGVGGRLEASRAAVDYFLDAARPGDEFSLATFAMDQTVVDVPFTEEIDTLRESIALWEPYGKTGLHDAVSHLPRISGDSRNVKRAAILITDGADNASRITALEARALVQRSELPVYVLGLESGDPYAVSTSGQEIYAYADVLNLLAHQTGGRYFSISGPVDLKEACAEIADELRYQYVLGFETTGTGTPAYHRIEVEVKGRKVKQVTHRKGYKGFAPASRR
jgi:VWFA-related protein